MRGYIKFFKTQLISGLQYKVAAIAGISTQIFWGFLNTMVFIAFYSHTTNSDISLSQLITYVWLNQAFLSLIYIRYTDDEVLKTIKTGTVAYELCRPYNTYIWWFIRGLSNRYARVVLRCLPIILLSLFLPEPFKLAMPSSILSFILFLITLIIGSILLVSILMIIQSIAFFTLEGKGISDLIFIVADLFAGMLFPLPLMPKVIQNIGMYLPFRLISDLPFRIYSGNIGISYALNDIVLQIIWIMIFVLIGQIIMKIALKKVCIQGG